MGSITYVKFMTREELINLLTDVHTFSMTTRDGKRITMDKRTEDSKPRYEDYHNIRICYHATAFKLSTFDYEDVLISGEGYVRYSAYKYGKNEPAQGIVLTEKYGFVRED